MGASLTGEKGLSLGFCGGGLSRSPNANAREESMPYSQPGRDSKYLFLMQRQEPILAWLGKRRFQTQLERCDVSDLLKFEYQLTLFVRGDHTPELKAGVTVWPIFECP